MTQTGREPFQPGDRFLKYEIGRLLGKGGHAFVYEATHLFLRRVDAIKIIPGPSESGRDIARRAEAEAQVLARLEHDNIVKVFDAGGTEAGLVYIVMERLVGRTLRDVLGELGRLTPAEAMFIAEQIARAVEAAHEAGIIHRDLKPENVFITPKNTVKVLDFGIAKVLEQGAPTTQKDLLHGTVLYMSPEQLQALRVTPRSDIFSLGTMLFECLHRHPALLGETPTLQELGWIQISRVPPVLSDVDPSIPRFVSRFVQRAISKNPEQRYASMTEVAQAAREASERLSRETVAATGVAPLIRDLSASSRAAQRASTAPGDAATTVRDPFPNVTKTERLAPLSGRSHTPTPVTSGVQRALGSGQKSAGFSLRRVSVAAAIIGFSGGAGHALFDWWSHSHDGRAQAAREGVKSAAVATPAPSDARANVISAPARESAAVPSAPAPVSTAVASAVPTASSPVVPPAKPAPRAATPRPAPTVRPTAAARVAAATAPSASQRARPARPQSDEDRKLWLGEAEPLPAKEPRRTGTISSALPGSGL
jgi:eukaryotic-like serine/threonine-protein kinase